MKGDVGRKPSNPHGPKVHLSVSLDPDLVKALRREVGSGRRYASISHAIDTLIRDRVDGKGKAGD